MTEPEQTVKRRGRPKRPFVGEGMKACAFCKKALPLSEFSTDRSRSDGYSARCRVCRQLQNRRYVKCEGCGGLRSASGGRLCLACYKSKGKDPVEPAIVWRAAWKDKERSLGKILHPPKAKGKNCEVCGEWFTFTGNSKKRKVCSGACGLEAGRRLAESQSKLPYDFDTLYDLYWNQGLGLNPIAKMYGLGRRGGANVWTRLKALGVPTRRKGARVTRTACLIDGCTAPIHRIKHATNGSWYGQRCLEHWVAHRNKLAQDYWLQIVRWRKLGLGEDASSETLSAKIERIVPKGLAYEVREEVCQELALKVMTREVALEDVEAAAQALIRHFYRQYQDRGVLSLDAPLTEEGFTLGDTIAAGYRR